MKKAVLIICSGLFVVAGVFLVSCKPVVEIKPMDPGLPSTKPAPEPGDMIQHTMGLLAARSLPEIINDSKVAFIGTVKEIMPAQIDETDSMRHGTAYTDVLIVPEKYLFGGSNTGAQIVRVYGGRVGNMVYWVEDEPTFTVTERVLIFARSLVHTNDSNNTTVLRIDDFRGKYRLQNDIAIQDTTNNTEYLWFLESLAAGHR